MSLGPNNIKNGRILTEDVLRISPDIESKHSRTRLMGGEVLMTIVGTVGDTAIVTKHEAGWNVARAVAVIPPKSIVSSKWIQLCLQSPGVRETIFNRVTTTVQTTLNLRDISELKIPMPSEDDRKAIAAVLGTLDNKIELNRRMNATLEAMARALFKSWFVDFDPVLAKMKGNQPFSMDTATAELFPSRLVSSSLGDIPEGWEVNEIGNAVTAVGGGTPKTEKLEYWTGGNHAWATPKDLSNLKSPVLLTTERKITDAGVNVISSGLLPAGTVLMSSRAPIGYIAIAEVPVAINQGFIAMVCNKKLPNLYVWFWTHNNLDIIKSHANGSTFQEISKSSFRPLPCIVPTESVLKKFQEIVSPIWQRIASNTEENIRLERQRNYLLPKLISGDIRISDVEKFVENI